MLPCLAHAHWLPGWAWSPPGRREQDKSFPGEHLFLLHCTIPSLLVLTICLLRLQQWNKRDSSAQGGTREREKKKREGSDKGEDRWRHPDCLINSPLYAGRGTTCDAEHNFDRVKCDPRGGIIWFSTHKAFTFGLLAPIRECRYIAKCQLSPQFSPVCCLFFFTCEKKTTTTDKVLKYPSHLLFCLLFPPHRSWLLLNLGSCRRSTALSTR